MLDAPLTLRSGLVLNNRAAVAAMTNGQSLVDGRTGDDEIHWLARRADGGFGCVATCAAYVSRDGKAWDGQLGIDRDDELEGLARFAERVQRGGCAGMVQLFHGGVRATQRLTGEQVWSATTFHEDGKDFETPREATEADIERVIGDFIAAAARAQKAGWNGVELHGAHGYLLTQFMSATQNTRGDRWGGAALDNRARLVREVMRGVRARVGPKFSVGVRLSFESGGNAKGLDFDEIVQVAKWLCDDGADFIHASLFYAERNTRKYPDQHPIPLIRAALPKDVALFACGNIWTGSDAAAALDRGADVVALARCAIFNPDWPRHAMTPGWEPRRPPATPDELAALAVSPAFVTYLRHFKNLVA
jgi:2,4-dienoyl-CoA reductase-like NADH-dependent reductase (Old Yellow Enzyme family)